MRWTLLVLVVACIGTASPSAADFVLQWSAPAIFPSSPNPAGAPLPAAFFSDFNGDGRADIIHQTMPDNPHMLVVRDAVSGAAVGQINLLVDGLEGSATGIGVLGVSYGLPVILVSYVTTGGVKSIAAYVWQAGPTTVAQTPAKAAQPVQARPNPFRQQTAIHFALAVAGKAELEVFDVGGRLVRKLDGGLLQAGSHSLDWDGIDLEGRGVSAGTYFYRVKVNGLVVGSQKAVMLQ